MPFIPAAELLGIQNNKIEPSGELGMDICRPKLIIVFLAIQI